MTQCNDIRNLLSHDYAPRVRNNVSPEVRLARAVSDYSRRMGLDVPEFQERRCINWWRVMTLVLVAMSGWFVGWLLWTVFNLIAG